MKCKFNVNILTQAQSNKAENDLQLIAEMFKPCIADDFLSSLMQKYSKKLGVIFLLGMYWVYNPPAAAKGYFQPLFAMWRNTGTGALNMQYL